MSELFYLQDSWSFIGNNVVFWRKNGYGYGTNLDELEVYTRKEAQSQHNKRNSDIPLLKSIVDELSIYTVDHQYLGDEAESFTNDDEYIVQIKDCFNGNDILFENSISGTYNYADASVFNKIEAKFFSESEIYAVFYKTEIDKIARRTFQYQNIDKRKMISKPGIKLINRRQTPRKTCGKCPECGKITWDYSPYENAYCAKHSHELAKDT